LAQHEQPDVQDEHDSSDKPTFTLRDFPEAQEDQLHQQQEARVDLHSERDRSADPKRRQDRRPVSFFQHAELRDHQQDLHVPQREQYRVDLDKPASTIRMKNVWSIALATR